MSFNTIYAAPPISDGTPGVFVGDGINYDCGSEATSCPDYKMIPWSAGEGRATPTLKLVDEIGLKPIPKRPGYEFVDWKITYINPESAFNGVKLKAGDLMVDWNSYEMQHLFSSVWNSNANKLDLKAVWEPLPTETSKVPINLSIPSTPINATLPSEILLAFSPNNTEAVIANDLSIINDSTIGVLNVTQIKARSKNDSWKLIKEDSASYFSTLPFDSHELYLGFSADGTNYTPLMDPLIDPQIKIDPKGAGTNRKGFKLRGMSGGSSIQVSASPIEIEFTFGYEIAEVDQGMSKEEAAALGYTFTELGNGTYEIGNTSISGDVVIPTLIEGVPVTQIAAAGFQNNDKITSVVIPESVTEIGSMAFNGCTNLENVSISDNVFAIGEQAFMSCTSLSDVKLSNSIRVIEYGVFQDCENLKFVSIPKSVKEIGSEAFARSTSLTEVIFEEGSECTRINDFAFSESGITRLVLPGKLSVIGMAAFGACINLTGKVSIPKSVTTIESLAFGECNSVEELTIPDSVSMIGEQAFLNVQHITYNGSADGAPWDALSMN